MCRWASSIQTDAGAVQEDMPDAASFRDEVDSLEGPHKLPGLSENGLLDGFASHANFDEDLTSPSEASTEGRPGTVHGWEGCHCAY